MRVGIGNLPATGVLAAVFCLLPAALLAQTGPDDTQRIAAFRKRAEDAYAARDIEAGNLYLRELIEACAGQWDVARPALKRILRESRNGPEDWQEYAALRLIAAYRAGRVLPTDPALRDAWGTLITLRGYQERFLEAKAEIEALGEATGRDLWVRFLEAALCWQADSYETEPRFAKVLSDLNADDNDPYVRAVWYGIYPSDGGRPNPKYLESAMAYRPGRLLPSSAPRNLYFKDVSPNWEAVRGLPPEISPSQIHALLGEAVEPERFVADDNTASVTWLWALIDRHLLSQESGAVLSLRRLQQAELRKADAGRPPGSGGPIDLFRRYPWAEDGQRQLLAYGRREMSDGRAGTALRSFRDVLSHAANPGLRSEAQVCLWLALAQQEDRGEFEAAFRGVDPEGRYPWMGGTEPARAIRERLQAGLPASARDQPAPRLADLDRRLVRIPALAPWPSSWSQADGLRWYYDTALMKSLPFIRVGMQLHDGGLLVSSPNVLAWYRADDTAAPVWQRTARFTCSNFRRQPGIHRPPIVGDRIYTRWGHQNGSPVDVAAIDTRTGRQMWSTAQDSSWRNQPRPFWGLRHWPLNDPVYADGRLYVLAARVSNTSTEGVDLFCLNPDTGARIWTCVVSGDEMKGADGWFPEYCTDLAIYGNAVTPHQGAVYCATGAGMVSRVDARDGRLEWAHRYPRTRYPPRERASSYGWVGDYSILWGAPP
ncbi:MAG: PQQ-like beta-propeller repeat protein, partial [Lentisphaerae bacterium]|nr:PQQ-like beta-propeller repeat protein [Lentisphaerota bacterium]